MKHDPEKKRKSKGEIEGSRPSSSLHDGILWKEGPRQEKVLQVIVQKGMLVITGIDVSVPFVEQELQIWE